MALTGSSGHGQTLIPLSSALPRPSKDRPVAPTAQVSLTATELVEALARPHGFHVDIEDSQFGLLKRSMTVSSDCFVIDIDIESDAVPEESAATPINTNNAEADLSTGQERLSGLRMSVALNEDKSVPCPHIRGVLERDIVAVIEAQSSAAPTHRAGRERAKRVQRGIDTLRHAFQSLKELDGDTKTNRIVSLETAAARVQELARDNM